MLRCDCVFWNEKNAGRSQEMYFRSNEIFNEEHYRKLITVPTSNDRICLAQIKRNARRNIAKEIELIYRLDDGIDSNSKYPPFEVERVCVDKITINVKVSKANNDETAL